MKKVFKSIASLLCIYIIFLTSSVFAQEATKINAEKYMAIGSSLNKEEIKYINQLFTLDENFKAQYLIDGNLIDNYLNDGSSENTPVYSSVMVERMPSGYGVITHIQTPSTLYELTEQSYQNLAITMGFSDVNIQIASTQNASGEGAVAGLESLAKDLGISLSENEKRAVQAELRILQDGKQVYGIDDKVVNQCLSQVKKKVIKDEPLSLDLFKEKQADVNLTQQQSDFLYNKLLEFSEMFKDTRASQKESTLNQIEASSYSSWEEILKGEISSKNTEDLLRDKLDVSDPIKYRPLIQAFVQTFYDLISTGQSIDLLYSHTLVCEEIEQDLSGYERQALNQLRLSMIQYAAKDDIVDVQRHWLAKIQQIVKVKEADPILAEIINRVAASTGLAPEVYDYSVDKNENNFKLEVKYNNQNKMQTIGRYLFDPTNNRVLLIKSENNTTLQLDEIYDFNQIYGWPVVSHRNELLIPENYSPSEEGIKRLKE